MPDRSHHGAVVGMAGDIVCRFDCDKMSGHQDYPEADVDYYADTLCGCPVPNMVAGYYPTVLALFVDHQPSAVASVWTDHDQHQHQPDHALPAVVRLCCSIAPALDYLETLLDRPVEQIRRPGANAAFLRLLLHPTKQSMRLILKAWASCGQRYCCLLQKYFGFCFIELLEMKKFSKGFLPSNLQNACATLHMNSSVCCVRRKVSHTKRKCKKRTSHMLDLQTITDFK